MPRSLKRHLPAALLALATIFHAAAVKAQAPAVPEAKPDNPVKEHRSGRSPHPLYATEKTLARLPPVIADRLAEWAQQPVAVFSKDDLYDPADVDGIPAEALVMTPHGPMPYVKILAMQGAFGRLGALMEANKNFYTGLTASGRSNIGIYMGSTVVAAGNNSPAAISFSALTKQSRSGCTIIVHDLETPPAAYASKFIGAEPEKMKNIPGDALSWNVYSYMHEAAGHCANDHRGETPVETLGNEIEADAVSTNKYRELVKEGLPLHPRVPQAVMDLRALSGMMRSAGEPVYRLSGQGLDHHATNVGVSFHNAGKPVDSAAILRSLMAVNTKIHDLVGRAFGGGRFHGENGENEAAAAQTPEALKLETDLRAAIGYVLSMEKPSYHYAAAKAMFDLGLIKRDTLAWRHMQDYIKARLLLPELIDGALYEAAKKHIRDNNLFQALTVDRAYEQGIIPACAPEQKPDTPCLK